MKNLNKIILLVLAITVLFSLNVMAEDYTYKINADTASVTVKDDFIGSVFFAGYDDGLLSCVDYFSDVVLLSGEEKSFTLKDDSLSKCEETKIFLWKENLKPFNAFIDDEVGEYNTFSLLSNGTLNVKILVEDDIKSNATAVLQRYNNGENKTTDLETIALTETDGYYYINTTVPDYKSSDIYYTWYTLKITGNGAVKRHYRIDFTKAPTNAYAKVLLENLKTKTSNLEKLLDKCNNQGLTTDYEDMYVSIINQQIDYMNYDIKNTDYRFLWHTYTHCFELYEKAIKNAEMYLSGEKTPLAVPKYVTSEIENEGTILYADTVTGNSDIVERRPVFLVGYNYLRETTDPIENVWASGANVIQREIGPDSVLVPDFSGGETGTWSIDVSADPEGLATTEITEEDASSGTKSLKVTNTGSGTVSVKQSVAVEPSSTYEVSFKAKVQGGQVINYSIGSTNARLATNTNKKWRNYKVTVTTGAEETAIGISLSIGKVTSLYLDDFSAVKTGTTENLVVNPGFEEDIINSLSDGWYAHIENLTKGVSASVTTDDSYGKGGSILVNYPSTSGMDYCAFGWLKVQKGNITLEKGKTYTLKFAIKGDIDVWINNLDISVDGKQALFTNINDCSDPTGISGKAGWLSKGKTFTYNGETTNNAVLSFNFRTGAWERPCIAYFDDISITDVASNTDIMGKDTFESTQVYYGTDTKSHIYMKDILRVLKDSQENNIAVDVLISPHYMPAFIFNQCPELKVDGRINYSHPVFISVMKGYLDALLPVIKDYKSLNSICLMNEPGFRASDFGDFYLNDFHNFIENKYGTIASLNTSYGTSYSSFSEVPMPSYNSTDYSITYQDFYDFNNSIVGEYHNKMKEIIKAHIPDVKLHSKIMWYLSSDDTGDDRSRLTIGNNHVWLAPASDYNGNDNIYYRRELGWRRALYKTFMYDYQAGIKDAPVFNSEDHTVPDNDWEISDKTSDLNVTDVWQNAFHGRSISTLWAWARPTNAPGSILYGGIMHRPDTIAGFGEATYDLNRLSYEVKAVCENPEEVAVLYSETSRVRDMAFLNGAYIAYEHCNFMGYKPLVLNEWHMERLTDNIKLVIVPYAEYITESALDKLIAFAEGGGKIIFMGENCLRYDDKGLAVNSQKLSKIKSYATVVPCSDNGWTRVHLDESVLRDAIRKTLDPVADNVLRVKDASTGKDVSDTEYLLGFHEGDAIISIVNYDYSQWKDKTVNIYLNGKKLTNIKELRSDEVVGDTITISPYKPLLLRASIQ